jgi:hypothetical protein
MPTTICRGLWFIWGLLLLLLLCGPASAQMITGDISGTVQDSSGAVIPAVNIVLSNAETGALRKVSSSANGDFVLIALRPGTYTLKVEKAGFQTYEQKGIVVAANQRVALGVIQLTVGQVTQSIEVTAQRVAVNTESADAVNLLSSIQVTDLGIKGRDVMQLLRVLPGVATVSIAPWGELSDTDPAATGSNGGQFGSFTPAVGGARLFWNTVTVDGQVGSNPDFPGLFMAAMSMDAVAEVKIVSNNYGADYGRNPGSTIAIVSKSGTKDFHGTVYGYKRSEKLNANDYFNNRDGLTKPAFRYGTFGFAVGGADLYPRKTQPQQGEAFLLLFRGRLACQTAVGKKQCYGSYRGGAQWRFLPDRVPRFQPRPTDHDREPGHTPAVRGECHSLRYDQLARPASVEPHALAEPDESRLTL